MIKQILWRPGAAGYRLGHWFRPASRESIRAEMSSERNEPFRLRTPAAQLAERALDYTPYRDGGSNRQRVRYLCVRQYRESASAPLLRRGFVYRLRGDHSEPSLVAGAFGGTTLPGVKNVRYATAIMIPMTKMVSTNLIVPLLAFSSALFMAMQQARE
ncbi:hypothetical protein FHX15_005429 [Rhizobium sp. BK650]|uniref:hypothetical protein n=1 Tax=Rhizobium sp. BK650 TaxID=2586990 RepID=UPI00161512E2|nr:hypothetical protein [Rhizobium sp. BK650]MBB3660160.1 hypothetical protein [Rhizobium sp. BK650]